MDNQYYICEGTSGVTYGVHVADETWVWTVYPSGTVSDPKKLEDSEGWSVARWMGQMGAEEVTRNEYTAHVNATLKTYRNEGESND